MKKIVKTALVLALCTPMNVYAVSESHKEAAERALPALGIIENDTIRKEEKIKELLQGFALSPCVDAIELGNIRDDVSDHIKFEDIKPYYVNVLVREFNEDELNEITRFFTSSAGKKALSKLAFLDVIAISEAKSVLEKREGAVIKEVVNFASAQFNDDGTCKAKSYK